MDDVSAMEAARIVERVMTEWGKQDSLRDMLDEITAELLAVPSPSPDVGEMNRGVAAGAAPRMSTAEMPTVPKTFDQKHMRDWKMTQNACAAGEALVGVRAIHRDGCTIVISCDSDLEALKRTDDVCAALSLSQDEKSAIVNFETVEEANAAGVFSGMLASGDTFGDEDDGPEGGHSEFIGMEDSALEDQIYEVVCKARNDFHFDGPAESMDQLWQRKAARAIVALITSSPPGDGKLREALEPFAALGGPNDGVMAAYYDCPDDLVVYANSGRGITAGDVREARRLLGMLHAPRAHQIPVWPEGPDACTPPLSPWREAIEAAAKAVEEMPMSSSDRADLLAMLLIKQCAVDRIRSLSPPAGDAG